MVTELLERVPDKLTVALAGAEAWGLPASPMIALAPEMGIAPATPDELTQKLSLQSPVAATRPKLCARGRLASDDSKYRNGEDYAQRTICSNQTKRTHHDRYFPAQTRFAASDRPLTEQSPTASRRQG